MPPEGAIGTEPPRTLVAVFAEAEQDEARKLEEEVCPPHPIHPRWLNALARLGLPLTPPILAAHGHRMCPISGALRRNARKCGCERTLSCSAMQLHRWPSILGLVRSSNACPLMARAAGAGRSALAQPHLPPPCPGRPQRRKRRGPTVGRPRPVGAGRLGSHHPPAALPRAAGMGEADRPRCRPPWGRGR